MTTTVLVTGIGGSIGIDVARSLARDPDVRVVGADSNEWGRRIGRRLCADVLDLPRADRGPKAWLDGLLAARESAGADFLFVNPDPELEALAELGEPLPPPHALPPTAVVATTLDKAATVRAAGRPHRFPQTIELSGPAELDEAFRRLTPPLWLRATVGPGGRGSLPVEDVDEARWWMTYWQRRGRADRWVIQELLPGRNLNWTGLYVSGHLVAQASMERLAYFLGGTTVSGVSGQVSRCATVDPAACGKVSDEVVRAIDPTPHGIYSVDLRGDRDGVARVTEVNPRLAGRPWLYTEAGVNLPLAAVRALTGGPVGDAVSPGGLALGLHLHRQLDVDPVVGSPEDS